VYRVLQSFKYIYIGIKVIPIPRFVPIKGRRRRECNIPSNEKCKYDIHCGGRFPAARRASVYYFFHATCKVAASSFPNPKLFSAAHPKTNFRSHDVIFECFFIVRRSLFFTRNRRRHLYRYTIADNFRRLGRMCAFGKSVFVIKRRPIY